MGYFRKKQQKAKTRELKIKVTNEGRRRLQSSVQNKKQPKVIREVYSAPVKGKKNYSPALKNFLGDLKISDFKSIPLSPSQHTHSPPALRSLVFEIHQKYSRHPEYQNLKKTTFQPDTLNKLRLLAARIRTQNPTNQIRLFDNPHGGGLLKFSHPTFIAAAKFAAPHMGYLLMKGINYLVKKYSGGSLDQKSLFEEISRIALLESKVGKAYTEKQIKEKEKKEGGKDRKEPKREKKKEELKPRDLKKRPQAYPMLLSSPTPEKEASQKSGLGTDSLKGNGGHSFSPKTPILKNHRGPKLSEKKLNRLMVHERRIQSRMDRTQPEIGVIDLIRVPVKIYQSNYYGFVYAVVHFLNQLMPSEFTAAQWGKIAAALIDDLEKAIINQISLINNIFRSWWWVRNSLTARVWNNVSYEPTITVDSPADPESVGFKIGQYTSSDLVYKNTALPTETYMTTADVILDDESYDLLSDALSIAAGIIPMMPNHGKYGFIWGGSYAQSTGYIMQNGGGGVGNEPTHPGDFISSSAAFSCRIPLVFPFEPTRVDIALSSLGFARFTTTTDGFDFRTPGKLHLAHGNGSPLNVILHMIYCDKLRFPVSMFGAQLRYPKISLARLVEAYLNFLKRSATEYATTYTQTAQEHAAVFIAVAFSWFKNWSWAHTSRVSPEKGGNSWYPTYVSTVFTTPPLNIESFQFPIYMLNVLYKFAPKVKIMEGSYSIFYPALKITNGPGIYLNASFGNVFSADASPNNYYTTFGTAAYGMWTINMASTGSGVWDDFMLLANHTPFARLPVLPAKQLMTTYIEYQPDSSDTVSLLTGSKLTLKKRSRLNLEVLPEFCFLGSYKEEVMAYLELDHEVDFNDDYTSQTRFSVGIGAYDWITDNSKPFGPDAMLAIEAYISRQDPQYRKFLITHYGSVEEGCLQASASKIRSIAETKLLLSSIKEEKASEDQDSKKKEGNLEAIEKGSEEVEEIKVATTDCKVIEEYTTEEVVIDDVTMQKLVQKILNMKSNTE